MSDGPPLRAAKERLEIEVLRAVSRFGEWCRYEHFWHLSAVTSPPEITRDIARALLRDLADRGLARYQRGLFSEDGMPAGAGYAITPRGLRYLCALEEIHMKGLDHV